MAFDEFAGKKKTANKALVDILKNYMANKSFSRGIETLGAEASMVFVGNIRHTLPYMLKHSDLFDELPEQYYDSAFLDRIHFYIPGWEVDIIRGEMFSIGYGFVVDYLAEILRAMRNHDYSERYQALFELSSDISSRDRDGINKTFSGFMKILFPQGEASPKEIEEILKFSIEGRKRVKDQLMRIDSTYAEVKFAYADRSGKLYSVKALEEKQYPQYFASRGDVDAEESDSFKQKTSQDDTANEATQDKEQLKEQHLTFQENQRGISFDSILGPYLKGASSITITDPYIRLFYQIRNLMEFMETIVKNKQDEDEITVHLVTTEDEFKKNQQQEYFEKIKESCSAAGIFFTYEFVDSSTIHARHLITDNGWKILLDRGLDIFQHYEMNDAFTFSNRLQQFRPCKAFEVTFLKNDELK